MMDFVLWYVLIGVALLLFRSDGKIVDAVKADWRPGKRLVLTSLVVLMTVGALVLWPVFLYDYLANDLFRKKGLKVGALTLEPEPTFAVQPEHLRELLSLQEIAERERVEDPLKAVPEEPFGHLHAAWSDFISMLPSDVELWSFEGSWITPYRKQLIAGYVEGNSPPSTVLA